MNDLEIRRLTAPAGPELAAMTFPAYRQLLDLEPGPRHPEQGDLRPVQPLAFVARRGGTPVGLILAELPIDAPGTAEAEPLPVTAYGGGPALLSVYVAPTHRQDGVATRLFEALEAAVRASGYGELEAIYTTGKPTIGHLERIFARRGWSHPEPRSVLVRFSPAKALAHPLLPWPKIERIGRRLEIFPWDELKPDERTELERSHAESPWIAPALVPWRFDHRGFDPSSVGARYRGRVVGWVINHRITSDVVRFTCSFMRGELARRGRIVPLYYASLRRLEGTCRACTFITPTTYDGMAGFIRRRLAPISSFQGETRGTRIEFDRQKA